ncbi:MAG: DEAD/DEAH box helicase [Rhodobacteraceae bacterium]|nr:DEAD/DEAH box helicase [Paracoccaceae bacterium]
MQENTQPPPGGVVLRAWQAKALPVVIEALKARKRAVVAAFMGAGKSYLIAELIRRSKEQEGRGVVVLAPRTALVEQLAGTFGNVLEPVNVGTWWQNAKVSDRRVTVSTYQSLPTLVERWKKEGRSCSLLVCDEAHRTEAGVILEAVAALEGLAPGRWLSRVGVTATPFRSDDKEALSLWDEVVYRYSYADALRDRVVVEAKVVGWDGVGNEAETDEICTRMLSEAALWPALASAKSIADAEEYAVYLGKRGIPAMAIHSQISRKEQAARIYALRSGAIKDGSAGGDNRAVHAGIALVPGGEGKGTAAQVAQRGAAWSTHAARGGDADQLPLLAFRGDESGTATRGHHRGLGDRESALSVARWGPYPG